jgi:hypothetical protein
LKSFREYTNPQEEEGQSKGWSSWAANDMQELITVLENESSSVKARLFCAAYRLSYKEKLNSGKKKRAI